MDESPMSGRLIIVGAGGFGRECLDVVDAMNEAGSHLEFVGFVDDGTVDESLISRLGATVLGGTEQVEPSHGSFVIGIGNGAVRERIDTTLTAAGLTALTLRHPSSTCGRLVATGAGSVVCAGVRLTTNITIGRHVHLNLNVTVGHDSTLADFVTVFPGATISGSVHIERGVTVGTGANILPGVTIGAGSFVGAGAVVNRDVLPGVTVAGVPARQLAPRT